MKKSKLMAIALFGIAVILSGCGSEVSSDGVGVSIHLDEEMHPYYATLTDSEKTVYEEILAGIETGTEEIPLSQSAFGEYTLVNVVQYIAFDNPQLFWYEGEAELVYDESGTKVAAVCPQYNDLMDDLEGNAQAIEDKSPNGNKSRRGKISDAELFLQPYRCRS